MSVHYSDEDLLRALDGELPRLHAYAVREHLRCCWRCRDRQAELEEQIRAVIRSLRDSPPTGPEWMSAQQERLRQSVHDWETTQLAGSRPDSAAPRLRWRFAPALAAAFAVAAVLSIWSWRQGPPVAPEPQALLADAVSAEAQLATGSLYQAFRVDYEVDASAESRGAGRLEMWTDPERGRFASRWTAETSGIDYYALRSRGQEYVFDRGRGDDALEARTSAPPEAPLTQTLRGVETPAEAENGFVQWLESREWKPLSLSAEMARFVDESGVALEVRRILASDGADVLQLSAQRSLSESEVARIVVELDSRTLEVRRQRVELRSGSRRASIVFTPERSERFTLANLPAAPFDAELVQQELLSGSAAMRSPGAPQPHAPLPRLIPADAEPQSRAVHDTVLNILLALHEQQICRSGTVVLQRDGAGWAFSMVIPADREARRLRALLNRHAASGVRVSVVSSQGAMENLNLAAGPGAEAAPLAQDGSNELPIEDALRRYFVTEDGTESTEARIDTLSREAVRISQRLLGEAQAIERILLVAPDARSRTDQRIQRMLSDHGQSLVKDIGDLRAVLRPALLVAAPDAAAPTGLDASGEWRELSDGLWRTDQLVHVLLAGADDTVLRASAGTAGQPWEVEAAAQLIRDMDAAAAGAVRWLASQTNVSVDARE